NLPRGTVRLQTSVTSIAGSSVCLSNGEKIEADKIVVATESDAAARLTGMESLKTQWNRTTNIYFAADNIPSQSKMLILRGDETGPIQSATVISNVAPEYAPPGKGLISVSLGSTDDDDANNKKTSHENNTSCEVLDSEVRQQLAAWFGESARGWRRLATFQIPFGLPNRTLDPILRSVRASDHGGPEHLFICGDYCETPSIQGAMNSGLRAAAAVLA
ncbi:FAD-dependent oxidoreductase, partial [Rubripirellula amarantea]|nr:FAD-dependent oxidoreductase [Rubripirellula amarantea]